MKRVKGQGAGMELRLEFVVGGEVVYNFLVGDFSQWIKSQNIAR